MFAQLFGYYLLDKNIISTEQLNEALVNQNKYKSKLGQLFTDAGYMTREQVEYVHKEQKRFDKKMGDLAVFLGFLTQEQMEELLTRQDGDQTAFVEALISSGYITPAEYENLIKACRQEFGHSHDMNDKDLTKDIISIYGLENTENSKLYADYAALFVRNSVRFIGDDFAFAAVNGSQVSGCCIKQDIKGSDNILHTNICGSEAALLEFASRYKGREGKLDAAGDFLNLQNGLYASNIFASDSRKLSLSESEITESKILFDEGVTIPLSFVFGKVYIHLC